MAALYNTIESKVGNNNKLDEIVGAKLSFFGIPYQLVDAELSSDKKGISLIRDSLCNSLA